MLSEQELLTGELSIEGRLIDASNATLFGSVDIDSETRYQVVYKPIAGERPLWDFPDGNLASREVAAYLVSKHGGFDCVPTTVLRDGPFGVGAVQEWINVSEDIDAISLGQSENPAIRNIAFFDVVINNTDRKFGHILPVTQQRIFGCDHGVSFHEEFKLRTVIWQFAGEKLLPHEYSQARNLLDWLSNDGGTFLDNLIRKEELSAMEVRIHRLIEEGFPFPSEDWPAIPWPPV
jgi:hypothetical protein